MQLIANCGTAMAIDPIPSELKTKMNKLARDLRQILSPNDFTLLVFNRGPNARMNYISSAQRPGMLAAFREFIAKHEDEQPMEQIAAAIPIITPKDAKPGDKFAIVYTVGEGDHPVRHLELLEWKDEDHHVED